MNTCPAGLLSGVWDSRSCVLSPTVGLHHPEPQEAVPEGGAGFCLGG